MYNRKDIEGRAQMTGHVRKNTYGPNGADKGTDQLDSCAGRQDATVKIGNLVLVNTGFHMRNKVTENYSKFGHASSRTFASPVLGRKFLEEYRFEGAPNY